MRCGYLGRIDEGWRLKMVMQKHESRAELSRRGDGKKRRSKKAYYVGER